MENPGSFNFCKMYKVWHMVHVSVFLSIGGKNMQATQQFNSVCITEYNIILYRGGEQRNIVPCEKNSVKNVI